MVPWLQGLSHSWLAWHRAYSGEQGTIEKISEDKYKVTGIVHRTNSGVDIKELPIRVWTQSYKEQIEEWLVGNEKVPQLVKVSLFKFGALG